MLSRVHGPFGAELHGRTLFLTFQQELEQLGHNGRRLWSDGSYLPRTVTLSRSTLKLGDWRGPWRHPGTGRRAA